MDVGREIQTQLDDQVPSSKIEVKQKVQPLSGLRKNTTNSQVTGEVDAMKYFNRLIIFAQREVNLDAAFECELSPFPVSLFSTKDQLMHEADKAGFGQNNVGFFVVDGGWLMQQCSWEKGFTWVMISKK